MREALEQAGIIGSTLHELLNQGLRAEDVRGWHLWTLAEDRPWLANPAGFIITCLRAGDSPPQEFVDLAELTSEEIGQIRQAWVNSEAYQDWPSLNDRLRALAPLWVAVSGRM